jgi:crotonobetainyl-CoA:carnitine CoA-transferase CaiB-like acyl-CoA transferase
MPGALDGYRILEIAQVLSGPLATRILADQGADVIKIEPPSGDILRHMGGVGGMTPVHMSVNRSKRSLVLDLGNPEGVDVVKRLVKTADVFVQNSRPGVAERLGVGPDDLRAINPRLIYVSISGFGETGPYSGKRVYDPLIQAMSGLTDVQSDASGKPGLIRIIIPDKVTGLTAAQSITAALLARERTGEGQHIKLAMLDAVIGFAWPEAMAYFTFLKDGKPFGKPVHRRDLVYESANGHIVVSTVAHREFAGFCRAAGKTEWLEDPRFKDTAGLVSNAKERLELMAEVILTRNTQDWIEALDREDVPCAPVLRRGELHEHEQIRNNEVMVDAVHPVVGEFRQARPPERMEGTPSAIRRFAPGLGEHTDEVLGEIGLTAADIEKLRAAGALGSA